MGAVTLMHMCRDIYPSSPQGSKTSTKTNFKQLAKDVATLGVLCWSNQGRDSKLIEPSDIVEGVAIPTSMCCDIKNPQAKIVPISEDVATPKLGCRGIKI